MTEDQLQAECWKWVWNAYPQLRRLCWHVPNGGARVLVEAVKFKAMGVLPGVADLHLFFDQSLYVFELKVGTNTLSQQQVDWRTAMEAQGAKYFVIRTFMGFRAVIEAIVGGDDKRVEEYALILRS